MEHSRADLEAFIETGLAHCRKGEWTLGLRYLSRVAELHTSERRFSPTFYAFLGYGQATQENQRREGLELCRHAAQEAFYDPEILLLLAKTELVNGNRKEAVAAVLRGRGIDPENRDLLELHEELGVRRPAVAKGLKRSHPVNRALGRLRHDLSSKPSDKKSSEGSEGASKATVRKNPEATLRPSRG